MSDSDDVMEDAGYDAWDIGDAVFNLFSFGFDEETFLFKFDPFHQYFELKDNSDVTMTYQSLMQLTEMTCQIFTAWQKRSAAVGEKECNCVPLHSIPEDWLGDGVNLYQLELIEREEFRAYSVCKVKHLFGGEEEVIKCKKEVNKIAKFLKQCLLDVLEQCLPFPLPYPVLSSLFSYLLAAKGLDKIGIVNKDQNNKDIEMECMDKMYIRLADVYDHLKVVMFNINPPTFDYSFIEKINLSNRFKLLVAVVEIGRIGVHLDESEINTVERKVSEDSAKKIFKEGLQEIDIVKENCDVVDKIVKEDGGNADTIVDAS